MVWVGCGSVLFSRAGPDSHEPQTPCHIGSVLGAPPHTLARAAATTTSSSARAAADMLEMREAEAFAVASHSHAIYCGRANRVFMSNWNQGRS